MSEMIASGPSAATRARCSSPAAWLPPVKATTRIPPACAAVIPAGLSSTTRQADGRVAEGGGRVQEEVGRGLAVPDHRRGEGAAREARPEAGDLERELHPLGQRGGGHAEGTGQRVEGGRDPRDRLQLGAEGGVELVAHPVERVVADGDAVFARGDLAGGGEGAAEKERVGL